VVLAPVTQIQRPGPIESVLAPGHYVDEHVVGTPVRPPATFKGPVDRFQTSPAEFDEFLSSAHRVAEPNLDGSVHHGRREASRVCSANSTSRSLIEHCAGSSWVIVSTPNLGDFDGLTCTSEGDC
jgi:hypothetical protein